MWSLSNSSHSTEDILFKHFFYFFFIFLLLSLGGPYISVGYHQYFIDVSPARLNPALPFSPALFMTGFSGASSGSSSVRWNCSLCFNTDFLVSFVPFWNKNDRCHDGSGPNGGINFGDFSLLFFSLLCSGEGHRTIVLKLLLRFVFFFKGISVFSRGRGSRRRCLRAAPTRGRRPLRNARHPGPGPKPGSPRAGLRGHQSRFPSYSLLIRVGGEG